jgi:hypothetical protein
MFKNSCRLLILGIAIFASPNLNSYAAKENAKTSCNFTITKDNPNTCTVVYKSANVESVFTCTLDESEEAQDSDGTNYIKCKMVSGNDLNLNDSEWYLTYGAVNMVQKGNRFKISGNLHTPAKPIQCIGTQEI